MDTLGRDIYHKFLIDGDDSEVAERFVNAIRFSTHGDFYLSRCGFQLARHRFPHFHDRSDLLPEDIIFKKILIRNGAFAISEGEGGLLDCVYETGYQNVERSGDNMDGICRLEFLVGADHTISYLCSIDESGRPSHSHVDFETVIDPALLKASKLYPGSVITIEYSLNGTKIRVNEISHYWDIYRSIGVNIPLLVVQVLLGRNIRTFQFVDDERLQIAGESIVYDLEDCEMVWFDLDETLICRWQPIWQSIQLLQLLRQNAFKLGLITRHTFSIETTLQNTGIDINLFDKVVKVTAGMKKSDFITQSHVFIDNEFAERLDVRSKAKATVLDVDQIEFINFDS